MYYKYDIDTQLKRILKNKSIFNENIFFDDDYVSDIYDGQIYRDILNSPDGDLIKSKKAFTLSINTDGISICEKSKLDIWIVYLVINEIKKEYRYCIDNVIIAGITFFFFKLK